MAAIDSVAVTFERILIPTDFSEISERALDYAKTFADQASAELLLVHVDPPVNYIVPPEAAWIDDAGIAPRHAEQLQKMGAELTSQGYKTHSMSLSGQLHDELLYAIKKFNADLMVIGTHGRKGLGRLLLGSDAESMLHRAACPVLSIGPGAPNLAGKKWSIREVLCATTFDPRSAELAAFAQKLAAQNEAELVFFHVKTPGASQDVDWVSFEESFRRHSPNGLGAQSSLRARVASVARGVSIADLAKQRHSDLIVMGAHPASSLSSHLAPGIAAKVLLEAPCPVMTLLDK